MASFSDTAAEASDTHFKCPAPGCKRKYAELWRLRVHHRADPSGNGSSGDKGHGCELDHCPRCMAPLAKGKAHLKCTMGCAAPRQAAKRRLLQQQAGAQPKRRRGKGKAEEETAQQQWGPQAALGQAPDPMAQMQMHLASNCAAGGLGDALGVLDTLSEEDKHHAKRLANVLLSTMAGMLSQLTGCATPPLSAVASPALAPVGSPALGPGPNGLEQPAQSLIGSSDASAGEDVGGGSGNFCALLQDEGNAHSASGTGVLSQEYQASPVGAEHSDATFSLETVASFDLMPPPAPVQRRASTPPASFGGGAGFHAATAKLDRRHSESAIGSSFLELETMPLPLEDLGSFDFTQALQGYPSLPCDQYGNVDIAKLTTSQADAAHTAVTVNTVAAWPQQWDQAPAVAPTSQAQQRQWQNVHPQPKAPPLQPQQLQAEIATQCSGGSWALPRADSGGFPPRPVRAGKPSAIVTNAWGRGGAAAAVNEFAAAHSQGSQHATPGIIMGDQHPAENPTQQWDAGVAFASGPHRSLPPGRRTSVESSQTQYWQAVADNNEYNDTCSPARAAASAQLPPPTTQPGSACAAAILSDCNHTFSHSIGIPHAAAAAAQGLAAQQVPRGPAEALHLSALTPPSPVLAASWNESWSDILQILGDD